MRKKIFKNSLVYFVQGDITKRIKIGKTNSLIEERLRNLQTGSPDKLVLLGASFEPYCREDILHQDFSRFRLHGEWFSPEKKLLDYINKNCFLSLMSVYYAYYEVLDGNISYDKAISMGDEKLIKFVEKLNIERFNEGIRKSLAILS